MRRMGEIEERETDKQEEVLKEIGWRKRVEMRRISWGRCRGGGVESVQ